MRWRRRLLILLTGFALAAVGPGCGVLRKKAQPADDGIVKDMREGRRPMGQVVMVETQSGFVLVRSPLAAAAPADSILVVKAQGTAGTTGKLKVTPERKKHLVAADIVEGAPKVGEVVFFQTDQKVVSTTPPPLDPAAASATASGAAPGQAGPVPNSPATTAGGAPGTPGMEGGSQQHLPPLGEPSGPRETVRDFPGMEPLPISGDGPGELPEPSDPSN